MNVRSCARGPAGSNSNTSVGVSQANRLWQHTGSCWLTSLLLHKCLFCNNDFSSDTNNSPVAVSEHRMLQTFFRTLLTGGQIIARPAHTQDSQRITTSAHTYPNCIGTGDLRVRRDHDRAVSVICYARFLFNNLT